MFEDINLSTDTVNQLSLLGGAMIFILTIYVAGKYIRQMKTHKSEGELSDENWDGIGEFKNPLPTGFAISMVGVMIWAVWYWFFGYPLNAYSQIGEYNEEVKAYNKTFEAKWANPDKETLLGMGEGAYLVQCAPCHGISGDGITGKAQGFDKRMTEAQVLHVIEHGQDSLKYPMGAMPGGMASGDDAKEIAKWIAGGMKGEKPASFAACASCHGEDGQGLGGQSPNLAIYDETLLSHVLEHGKTGMIGVMPAFRDSKMSPIQKKAVAVYIQSLQEK